MDPAGRSTTVRFALAVSLALTTLTAACDSAPTRRTGPTSTTTGSSITAANATSTSAPKSTCAWPYRADQRTLNVAYPDTGATYWTTPFALESGDSLWVLGRFPSARYMSFITYGPNGGARTVLTDRDITPTQENANPFRGRGGVPGGEYDARIDTQGTRTGTLIYRVYLPAPADDPAGGAGLPAVRIRHRDGTSRAFEPCPAPGRNPRATAIVNANGPATNTPAPAQPVFIRPRATAANLYPNPDNTYIATILRYRPGQVVIVRGKAPTFPDTSRGVHVGAGEQVRYWSLCTNEYRKPYPVSSCVADHAVILDRDGRYTIIVAAPEDRPRGAATDSTTTWLDWGSTSVDNVLLFRHMLADPTFKESAFNLQPGALAISSMGDYAPSAVYCPVAEVARVGPAACG